LQTATRGYRQKVDNFSQKMVGNDPPLPQFVRVDYDPAMIGGI
jgi:hypothetical protein